MTFSQGPASFIYTKSDSDLRKFFNFYLAVGFRHRVVILGWSQTVPN